MVANNNNNSHSVANCQHCTTGNNNNNKTKTKNKQRKSKMLHIWSAMLRNPCKQQQHQQQLQCCQMLLLWLLLLLLSCSYHVQATAYSAKLSNCYEIHNGFNGASNGSAPRQSPNATQLTYETHGQRQHLLHELLEHQHELHELNSLEGRQQLTNSTAVPSSTARPHISGGWKCCCWNATTQDEVECRCEGEALTRVPQTLSVPMQRLTIASAGLPRLRNTGLKVYANSLLDIVLTDLKQLNTIENGAFASLRLLRTIYISHAPQLVYLSKDVFQGISDTIKIIRIINSGLISVPDLVHLPPNNILQMIDLDNNHITRIEMKSINIKTDQLILANNEISYIDDSAFYGSQIANLILKENRNLKQVHPNAFTGMSMQELDLSSTSLVRLPSAGLQDIEELRIENTQTLKTIPSIYNFKEIAKWRKQCTSKPPLANDMDTNAAGGSSRSRELRAHETETEGAATGDRERAEGNGRKPWEMHLARANPARGGGVFYSRLERTELSVNGDTNETELQDYTARNSGEDAKNYAAVAAAFADDEDDYVSDSIMKDSADSIGIFHDEITINKEESQLDEYCGNFTSGQQNVVCYPMPNALNPCEDVMGYQWLRISVWIVVALAVVGNVAVLMVILSIKSESASVPRFLMCHLAFADLCLGLYLLLIASIDAHSMGEYFNYAYDWQYGAGCKVAGFLTVFASHLSVFTLTVITIERWLAITHALYLNQRIKLRSAAYIMVAGWIYSVFMSLLPLFGISNYSSTSICLPMETGDTIDTVYLVLVLGLNGAAFFIIAICYAQIYFSLGQETRHAHNTHPGEMSVAKKMALLVFTNFSCWAPIAFFGLTALAGYPLINVTKSKILLVFFYPLNSCADPYLYAILTSQYRQDLYTLLGKFGICKANALKYKDSVSMPATTNFTLHGSTLQRQNSTNRRKSQQSKSPETQFMLKQKENFV